MLVLDESLSSLDIPNRRAVLEAVRDWRRGKTTIIITHDIAEIGPDDLAYVMESGSVVQKGYRRDLETVNGTFRSFVAASGKANTNSLRELKHRRIPQSLSIIPELNSDFWNKSHADLRIESPLGSPAETDTSSRRPRMPFGIRVDTSSRISFTKDRRLSGPGVPSMLSPLDSVFSNRFSMSFDTLKPQEIIAVDGDSSIDSPAFFSEDLPMIPKPHQSQESLSAEKLSTLGILCTVWPALSTKFKIRFVLGFVAALFHAAGTPLFSYALARLLGSILDTRAPPVQTKLWSLIIVGIAVADAFNCYWMFYLLGTSGQAWADHHRIKAFSKVLDQPQVWFYDEENSVSNLVEDLEKHVEEMRGLVARFAGYGFVGLAMTGIGTAWAMASSWKLALVGVCVAPVMWGISRGMGWASERYESRSNAVAQKMGGILHEAITNIATVRNYGVERYFRSKYFGATREALRTGLWRSGHAGLWFGLSDSAILFATGGLVWACFLGFC